MRTHPQIDARSLAMHCLAADALRREPARFAKVRAALERWLTTTSSNSLPEVLEWKAVVDAGLGATLELALQESERATALRQSSPVTIVLSNQERFDFLRQWRQQAMAEG